MDLESPSSRIDEHPALNNDQIFHLRERSLPRAKYKSVWGENYPFVDGMKQVLLPWPTQKDFVEVLKDAEIQLSVLRQIAKVDTSPILNEEEWLKRSKDTYVIGIDTAAHPILKSSRYPEFLESAKELRMIQVFSIGYDDINIATCTERGVIVCNVAEVMAESAAQHTWALILAVSKQIARSDRLIREGGWLIENRFGLELHGKTLGIIGLGDIGGRVALKGALAFGMKILAYDPYVLPARAQLYRAKLVDLATLLKESDVVSVNCPLTKETRHLISAEKLKLLKPNGILVNTARGPIIDEAALVKILKNRSIFGAGLDVYEEEPLKPTSPLRELDNVVLTSHLGSWTREAQSKKWQNGITNIMRFVRGDRPYWIVNPTALTVRKQG
jgi:phosphoglycerate dehydrogenase-like enzyme